MREPEILAAWLKAHDNYMPMSPDENRMFRAGVVMRDLYMQNKILRELLGMGRKEPHDTR